MKLKLTSVSTSTSTSTNVKYFDNILKGSKNTLKILVRRTQGLGDVLLTLPILKGLKEKYNNLGFKTTIDFLTDPIFKEICLGFTDNIVTSNTSKYHLEIDLQGKVDYLPICDKNHRQDLLADICNTSFDKNFRLKVPEEEIYEAKTFLREKGIIDKPIIGVAPFSIAKTRTWNNFYDLPRVVGAQLLLIHNKGIQVPGFTSINTSLKQLSAIIQCCNAVVTSDNGVLHLAGMLGVPFVGLFGPIDPDFRTRYYKNHKIIWLTNKCNCCPCWDWQLKKCSDVECMDIPVELVGKKLSELLKENKN